MLQTESPSQRIHPTFRLPGDELPAYFTHRVHGNVLTVSLPRISLSKQILRYKACIVVESRPGPGLTLVYIGNSEVERIINILVV